jgi:hypothetical protein
LNGRGGGGRLKEIQGTFAKEGHQVLQKRGHASHLGSDTSVSDERKINLGRVLQFSMEGNARKARARAAAGDQRDRISAEKLYVRHCEGVG